MDFNAMIAEKVTNYLDVNLEKVIEKNVESCVAGIFDNLFNLYRGGLGEQIQAQLKESLQINLSNVKIETYNGRVLRIVEDAIEKHLEEAAIKPIRERIKKTVSFLEKTEWKMSEIVKEFAKDLDFDDDYVTPTIIIERSSYGSTYIYLDKEENKRTYECEYQLIIHENDKKVWRFEINDYGKKVKDRSFHGSFDNLIFALYANQCTVEIDDYDTEFYREGYDD